MIAGTKCGGNFVYIIDPLKLKTGVREVNTV